MAGLALVAAGVAWATVPPGRVRAGRAGESDDTNGTTGTKGTYHPDDTA
jgi:hypothetical protein